MYRTFLVFLSLLGACDAVQRVIDADDRTDLRALADGAKAVLRVEAAQACRSAATYWGAFALWRYATNASNLEGADRALVRNIREPEIRRRAASVGTR